MTDVGIAPAPAPAAAPSAPAEAVINPSPITPPAPLSDTGPQMPDEAEKPRYNSRREAIDAAFKKAEAKGRPGAAEAKKGHNNPPEEIADENKLDLHKRPADQPSARARGEHGHFVKAEQSTDPKESQQGVRTEAAEAGPYVNPLPESDPYREPPQRMAEAAKARWHEAPEPVRAEVRRMQHEFSKAYQRYKADHEAMNEIRPYHDLARQQGTTLGRAIQNYDGIENKLRQDPIGGLDVIVNNLNLRAQDGRRLGLYDVAWHIVNQTPEQLKITQAQNAQTATQQRLAQMEERQQAIVQQQRRMAYQQRFVQTRSAVDRFAEANPRLDELSDLIERELRLGFDLPTAYKRANLLRPSTAAQTRGGSGSHASGVKTAPQTRTPSRSISGAPDGGPGNGTSRPRTPPSRQEALAFAFRHVNGSL